MATYCFVRHGQSTANAGRTLAGWDDVPLTALGRRQAREAGRVLRGQPFDLALVSDLQRAVRTADLLLAEWSVDGALPPVRVDQGLRERNLGRWQGAVLDDLRARGDADRLTAWATPPPGGESQLDLARRVLAALDLLEDGADSVLLVAHGGVIRVVTGLVDGLDHDAIGQRKIANAQPMVREVAAGTWRRLLDGLQ
jgi:Fructose-2,6-bisphosphatase